MAVNRVKISYKDFMTSVEAQSAALDTNSPLSDLPDDFKIPASLRRFSTSSSGGGVAGSVIRTEAPDGKLALNVPPRSPAAELSDDAVGDCSVSVSSTPLQPVSAVMRRPAATKAPTVRRRGRENVTKRPSLIIDCSGGLTRPPNYRDTSARHCHSARGMHIKL